MNRRELLIKSSAAAMTLGLSRFPLGWAKPATGVNRRRVLMYTKSEGYQHDVVKRTDGKLSLAEEIVTDLGRKNNFDVNCTKDGRVFVNDDLGKYHAFLFETQGDLFKEGVDKEPPMTPDGKKAFLRAIENGRGFVGCHCASDTFHSAGDRAVGQAFEDRDPYIQMLGGEFIVHGAQQKAYMRVVEPPFPGLKGIEDFELLEEWYSLKNFSPDIHVILVQDTQGMKGKDYERPIFPATWARMHKKGRVFFTSLGHRDDVWKNPTFHKILLGGLSWAMGNLKADITPNLSQTAPHANTLPKRGE